MQMDMRVKALYIYPVKSCRGISLRQASISSTGFQWDRLWMVVSAKGRFATQRTEPKLAVIEVTLPPEALDGSWGSLAPDAALCTRAPGMEPLYVSLVPAFPLERVDNVVCWEWSGSALLEGPDAGRWFSEYLGKPMRLVRFDTSNASRLTDPQYAVGHKAAFSDGYPYLLISQASLNALNEKLSTKLPINRFRPNIFVEGCEAFAEDKWGTFTIGGRTTFHGVKLCARCKVTTIEQETGLVGKEPLPTLKTFRAGSLLADIRDIKHKVFFGQNLTCEDSQFPNNGLRPHVQVGDAVNVLQTATITEIMS